MITIILLLCLLNNLGANAYNELRTSLKEADSRQQGLITKTATLSYSEVEASPTIVRAYSDKDLKNYSDLYSFLKRVPGFDISEDRFNQRFINVRGINQQVYNNRILVLINGHKIAFEIGPETNLNVVPIRAIKRLEIIRGPSSVLYGSSAYAAIISITTFSGDGYNDSFIETGLGTDSFRKTGIYFFEQFNKDKNLYLAFDYQNFNGENRPYKKQALVNGGGLNIPSQLNYARFESYALSDDHLNFLATYNQKNLQITAGSMRDYKDLNYKRRFINPLNTKEFNKVIPYQVTRNNALQFIGINYETELNQRTKLHINSKYNAARQETIEGPSPADRFIGNSYDYDYELRIRQDFNKLILTSGFSRKYINYQQIFENFSPNFLMDMIPKTSLRINALYLQADYKLDQKYNLLLAIRQNQNSLFEQKINIPKVALTRKLRENEFLKFIYAKSFRYPSGYELLGNLPGGTLFANKNLNAEKSDSFEINYSYLKTKQRFEISLFRQNMSDFITRVTTPQNEHQNLGKFRSYGIEFDFENKFTNSFKGFFNLTILDFNNSETKDLLLFDQYHHSTVKKLASIGFEKQFNDKFSLNSVSHLRGRQKMPKLAPGIIDSDYQGSIITHDLNFNFNLNKDTTISLKFENAFNKAYRYPDYDLNFLRQVSYPIGRQIKLYFEKRF